MADNLSAAKKNKNDEFYTQLTDIEDELKHYKKHLKGKTLFLNCDDPTESNFWIHFILKFNDYGLKKVISTHYAKPDDNGGKSYKLEFAGAGVNKTPLTGNGDFRSEACIELLKEADIVITNPPFSLFREYIAQLVEHGKQFLVIGNNNSITYKETFKLIKENKLWLGVSPRGMDFRQPDGTMLNVNACWLTNLTHKKRNKELILVHTYAGNEASYPKYDNYDAIEVSKVALIPKDYDGAMGVPITFLDKFNPGQFEIVGRADANIANENNLYHIKGFKDKGGAPLIKGLFVYKRVLIKKKAAK